MTSISADAKPPKISLWGRYKQLIIENGPFKGTRLFLRPAPKPGEEITEHLSLDVQILIYAVSLIALVVSGSQEIIFILRGDFTSRVIAGIILALFFIAVLSMDRSFARTIPRIPLLTQRGEWAMAIEHSLFALCVATIEISSIFVLIINEPNIAQILNGHPLLAAGSTAFNIAAGARAVLIVWTIAHSYLSSRKLPPLFKSFHNAGAILVAQKLLDSISKLGETDAVLRFRELYRTGVQLYKNPRRAPRKKLDKNGQRDKTYDRHAEQETLDTAYENALITAFEELENALVASAGNALPFTFAQVMEAISQAVLQVEQRLMGAIQRVAEAVEVAPGGLVIPGAREGASTKPQGGVEVPSGNTRKLADYDETAPELSAYELPAGVDLETTDAVDPLADLLGVPGSTLAKLFKQYPMPKYERQPGQPASVKWNFAVWEVLALVDTGLLALPKNVRKRTTVEVTS